MRNPADVRSAAKAVTLQTPAQLSAPRLRLPVAGAAKLYAELSGSQGPLGHPRVTGEFRTHRSPSFEVLMMEGPLTYEESPHALWVHVGTCAFRTDPAQVTSLQDFIDETERYSHRLQAANERERPDDHE